MCCDHSVYAELCLCVYRHRGVYYSIRRIVLFRRSKDTDIQYYHYYHLPHYNIISMHVIFYSINALYVASYPYVIIYI